MRYRIGKMTRRRGAITVEFALLMTILVFLVLGMVEVSHLVRANQVLSNAARSGCRLGCQEKVSNADVEAEVLKVLSENGIPTGNANVSIRVNDAPADVTQSKRHDRITVDVSVPVSDAFWSATLYLPGSYELRESITMMRQS